MTKLLKGQTYKHKNDYICPICTRIGSIKSDLHWLINTPFYHVWANTKYRCNNPTLNWNLINAITIPVRERRISL